MEENSKQVAIASKVGLPSDLKPASISRELQYVRSVGDALALASDREKYPSLALIRRDYGNEVIEDLIMAYLLDLRKKVNAKRNLSDEQIEEIAFEVVSTFYNFTIADIHLVFRWAKLGKYGELYESIDMPKVMNWFEAYDDAHTEAATQENVNNSGTWNIRDNRRESERWSKQLDKLEKKFNKGKK